MEIKRNDFPWIFEKGDRPSLVNSTLEALAILVALKLRFGEAPDAGDKRVLVFPSITDNRGNGAALNKLMSTRFPLLGSTHGTRDLHEMVEWAPREFNKEADKLANGNFEPFDPAKRLPVTVQSLTWNILPDRKRSRESVPGGQDFEWPP